MKTDTENAAPEDDQEFETSPEQATSLDGGMRPGIFNRKKTLIVICISLAVVIGGGLIFNSLRPPKKNAAAADSGSPSNTQTQFLTSLRDQAVNRRIESSETSAAERGQPEPQSTLPQVVYNPPAEAETAVNPPRQQPSPPPPSGSGPSSAPQQAPTYFQSSLVPSVPGSLFSNPQFTQPQTTSLYDPYSANPPPPPYGNQSPYSQQNDQLDKNSFLNSSSRSEAVAGGRFLGENSLWQGTIIPGILITAINTDLPGFVLARVTQNIFDSQTGRRLLIPQGTVLVARYNSSVSYAQNRVQIIWDTIIRPDGLLLDLGGAAGVDTAGMSGQAAVYHENWFEYLKAAGIIALFSVANSKMTETAAQYAADEAAASVAASGAQVTGRLGENLISRALDIQPRLTVDNGTLINIMLNKTVYLPPVSGYPVSQRYFLE